MNRTEQLQAELELLQLEEAFREKKANDELTDEDRVELREARRAYRESVRVSAANGVQPAVVGAEADMEDDE